MGLRLITVIAGSRTARDAKLLDMAMDVLAIQDLTPPATVIEVVSGTARGGDQLGEAWADTNGVPCRRMPPDWDQHGRKAGFLRNKDMLDYATGESTLSDSLQGVVGAEVQGALVALWDGRSRGTAHTIGMALDRGLRTVVALLEPGIDLGPCPLRDRDVSMLWNGRTHRSVRADRPERFTVQPKGPCFLIGEGVVFSEPLQIVL